MAAAVGRAKAAPRTPEAARALCALVHQGELTMVHFIAITLVELSQVGGLGRLIYSLTSIR